MRIKVGRDAAKECFHGGIGELPALPAVLNRDGRHSNKSHRHLWVHLIDELRHGTEGTVN